MKSQVLADDPTENLLFVAAIPTDLGWFGAVRSQGGVCGTALFKPSREDVLEELSLVWPGAVPVDADTLPELSRAVQRYAQGQVTSFETIALDWRACSPFQHRVLAEVWRIPWGDVLSYAEVAQAVGKPQAARAVGQVMARNPLPLIVPCHRVIASDGSLGGFSAIGGTATKRRLLELEGWSAA